MLAPAKVPTETEPYLACGRRPSARIGTLGLCVITTSSPMGWRTRYCWAAAVHCDRLLTGNSMGKLLHVGSTGCMEALWGHSNYNQLIIKRIKCHTWSRASGS